MIVMEHAVRMAAFGGVAAGGFGVLFNLGRVSLVWCMICGALALGVRTLGLDVGWSLEGASLVASAVVTTLCVGVLRRTLGIAGTAVAVAGCIPMVPGAFFAQALLGMFALTSPAMGHPEAVVTTLAIAAVRVMFTLGAIGAGISIPATLLRVRDF